MSEIEKYYDQIISKAEKLLEEKKYDEAIFLIEDELEAPYIPLDKQTILEDLLLQTKADKSYFSGLYDVENLDRRQLLNKVFENKKINPSALWLFFERYNSDLKENEIDFFEDILVSKTVSNEDKNSIFEMFICFGIDKNFKYHNQNIGESFNINPAETSLFEQIELYTNTKKIIDDLASKEPSLLNFCYNILTLIYKYYFPSIPNYDYKELAKSIFGYMYNTLRGEKIKDDEITSLINKILQ